MSLPCSSFSGLLEEVDLDDDIDHIPVTSEAEAVGIASGAWLAGRRPAIVIQNSGFFDALNPICSLLNTFAIPIPFIVSVRGGFSIKDAAQHDLTGGRFFNVLGALDLDSMVLDGPKSLDELRSFFSSTLAERKPAIVAVPPGTLSKAKGVETVPAHGSSTMRGAKVRSRHPADRELTTHCGSRDEVIKAIRDSVPVDSVFVCSTGYIGRSLNALGDAPSQLYVAGSMGCASAIGLGISRFTSRPVVVLDGDGAALMRMGNLATIANNQPHRLIHIILNNGVFESTGGQGNYARKVDFSAIAGACGYSESSCQISSLSVLSQHLSELNGAKRLARPVLFDVLIAAKSELPAARPDVTCPDQAVRLQKLMLADGAERDVRFCEPENVHP